jgi:hypothetical protein
MRTRRGRLRLLGGGLAIYGLVGIILFVIVAIAVARPLERARELSESVDKERTALVNALAQAETTIRGMATGVSNMDTSLSDAKTAIDQADQISRDVAASMYGLRDAMSIEIPLLGGQPLIGLAGNFNATGDNLLTLATDISAIGTALEANRSDLGTTATNLASLADSVKALTTSVEEGPALAISKRTLDAARLAVYAISAWLVTFAIGCLIAGVYLINLSRRPPPVVTTAAD